MRKPITWPENVEPTPEQFADWFVSNDRDERIAIAGQLLDQARVGALCFLADHTALVDEITYLMQRLADKTPKVGEVAP